jgi:hypothetical protein
VTRTHEKVRYLPERKDRGHTPASAGKGIERALKMIEGRWKRPALDELLKWVAAKPQDEVATADSHAE